MESSVEKEVLLVRVWCLWLKLAEKGQVGAYIQRESVDGLSRGGAETESQASTCAERAEEREREREKERERERAVLEKLTTEKDNLRLLPRGSRRAEPVVQQQQKGVCGSRFFARRSGGASGEFR